MNQTADLQTVRTSQAIARAAGHDVAVTTRTIGRGGVYRNAFQAAAALRFGRGILFDVVHAWDTASVLGACGSPSPVVYSPSQPPGGAPPWLRPAMVYRNGTVIANSTALQRTLIRRGAPAYRCDIIRPAIDFAPIDGRRNDRLRKALGIGKNDFVVLAPGESTRAAGHLLALHAVSILHVLDPRFRMLIWGRGKGAGAVARMAQAFIDPRVLVIAEREAGGSIEFEELLGTADLALFTGTATAPPLPSALCMAAGLALVALDHSTTRELVDDDRAALIVPRPSPRLLAKAVLDLSEDRVRSAELGRAAASAARRNFDPRRTAGQFLSLYRRAAGVTPKGISAPININAVHESETAPLASR